MLIFKADKDLKELEKFGFKPKYDINTGEICAYEKIKDVYEGGIIIKRKETTERKAFVICKRAKYWEVIKYKDYFDIDVLYDLTKAGLIDKY